MVVNSSLDLDQEVLKLRHEVDVLRMKLTLMRRLLDEQHWLDLITDMPDAKNWFDDDGSAY